MMPDSPFWAAYLTVLAFFFGACVGSFLNVCIHRIPYEESVIHPRSHCPKCGHMIAWYDNIPLVSWLALRAKCRGCGAPISPRYFLVELLTALLFLAAWNLNGISVITLVHWLVISGLILGTFVDFEHMIIPDRVTLGGMAAGLVCSTAFPVIQGRETWMQGLLASAAGLAIGSGLLLAVGQIGKMAFKKDAMGLGDVKLLGAIGAFFGWPSVLFTIMVSSLAGSAVGIALILRKNKEWQSRIPYGPYIALAALIWMLGGSGWWDAYVKWLMGGG
jgi:leader peptidase (prepilin peptidase)/N-methyltransferase